MVKLKLKLKLKIKLKIKIKLKVMVMVKDKIKVKVKIKGFISVLMVIHYAKTTEMAMTKIWLISMEARRTWVVI